MFKITSGVVMLLITNGFTATAASPSNSSIEINSAASRVEVRAPETFFTGQVLVDPLFLSPKAPQRATGSVVTFEPGARTVWHTHPVGQTLVVTSGTGWVQEWGKQKIEIHTGDVINFPPDIKHWHGATDKSGMVHLAIQELNDHGNNVNWMEKVSDANYLE